MSCPTGNDASLLAAFQNSEGALQKHCRKIFCTFNEASVSERYKKMYGGAVQQEEAALLVTRSIISLSGRKRLHYPGTNRGTNMGLIMHKQYTDKYTFQALPKEKKEIFGRANRVAVGGSVDDGAGEDQTKDDQFKDNRVCVCIHVTDTTDKYEYRYY